MPIGRWFLFLYARRRFASSYVTTLRFFLQNKLKVKFKGQRSRSNGQGQLKSYIIPIIPYYRGLYYFSKSLIIEKYIGHRGLSVCLLAFRNLRFSKSILVTAVCLFHYFAKVWKTFRKVYWSPRFVCLSVCLFFCLQTMYRPQYWSNRPDFLTADVFSSQDIAESFFFQIGQIDIFLLPWKPIAQWWEMRIFQYFDILFLSYWWRYHSESYTGHLYPDNQLTKNNWPS